MKLQWFSKFLYGDIPDGPAGGNTSLQQDEPLPLWEVFIRSKNGLDHKHAGSLHAADADSALSHARDVYTRRQEGVSIWVVESKHIFTNQPDQSASWFDPAGDKIYRHPTFYQLPDELNHM